MPSLQELVQMSVNEVHDLVLFAVIEPIIGRQSHTIQRELGFITAGFDVDVRWPVPRC